VKREQPKPRIPYVRRGPKQLSFFKSPITLIGTIEGGISNAVGISV
jgi:hypothetical protein